MITGNTGEGTTPGLHPLSGPRTDRLDRRDCFIDIAGQCREQTRHGRIRGHQPEDRLLGPDRGGICQAVTAERDRNRHIQQDLSRIMTGARPAPRRNIPHARPATLTQQQFPRRRDQQLARRIKTNIRDRARFRLRSAFHLSFLDCRKNKNPKQERHFRTIKPSVAPSLTKSRG